MELKEFSNRIDQWDQRVILKYNAIGGKSVTIILRFLSFFGRETLWLFLIAFYLLVWYDPYLLAYLSAIFITGLILILLAKQTVKRKRPFERFTNGEIIVSERKPTSRSFPSWHSYNVIAEGLLFGVFFMKSPLITFLLMILVLLVCFSRIQLGVHYPSDVIFGCVIGIIGFLLSIYLIGPLIFLIMTYIEQFIVNIQYQQVNSLLFRNFYYSLLCFSIFLIIFLLAFYKRIYELLKKSK